MDKKLVYELGIKVKSKEITWNQASEVYDKDTGEKTTGEIIRGRFNRCMPQGKLPAKVENKDSEVHNKDGSVFLEKEIFFDENEEKTPETIIKKFGYAPESWELVEWRFGKWEVAIKDEKNRVCVTIRAKLKPKNSELTLEDVMSATKQVMKDNIEPLKFEKSVKNDELDDNLMMELPAIELHLGKMAWNGDVGNDYDYKIAKERFYKIVEETSLEQDVKKCGTLFLTIGNDFFNSDTVNATTTKGTPQTNDLRWKKMFLVGLQMYESLIVIMRERFNKVDIALCSGNHDKMSSFYLYVALQNLFREDNKVNFSDDYKDVQCYKFGKNAIFFTHGDTNFKRLMASIPAEFYKEWGSSIYRELHLGHLHKEMVVDDNSGMITRRIGSPTGTDQWHYEERYIGATQKHQLFIWDKEEGLQDIKYINFNSKKKQKTRSRSIKG